MPRIVKIRLAKMVFYAYHGALAEEKSLGQRFEIDVEFEYDAKKAIASDQLKEAISYVEIYQIIASVTSQQHYKLLETLGDKIIEALRQRFPLISILLRIRKPSVPIPGILDHVQVEMQWPHHQE